MAEIQNLCLEAPICSPFKDIVNTFLQRVQEDICKNTSRTQITQKAKIFESCPNQKQINTLLDSKKINQTLKIQKNLADQNFTSARTIQKVMSKPQQIQDNPQWDFLQDLQNGEISHILRTEAQFCQIIKVFVQFAKKQKLVKFQQTSSFVTVKKVVSGSCRCFLKIWTSSEPEVTVYQLRKYGKINQRVKLILIQGSQPIFNAFYFQLLRLLSQKNLIKLLQGEKLRLIFDEEKTKILECAKNSQKMRQNLAKNKEVKQQEIQSLVANIKQQNTRLKELIKQTIPDAENLPTLERQIEDFCFQNSGIAIVFQQLYSKDYAKYREKRVQLLKQFNICELFLQLEIGDHYEQFKRRRSLKELELAEEKIPYMLAVRQLQKFSKMSLVSAALQSIFVFHEKIRVSYNNYFKNTFKLGDMDDFLPITIFCVLAVDCEENVLGMVKMLLSQFQAFDEAEWQKKTLTDIEAAFQFILNQWKITQ